MRHITKSACQSTRHGVALPLYAIALMLSFPSDALGRLAAWIAGHD